MAHIHTNPGEHDHTASAFIVRTDTVEPQLLLHKHKKLGVLLQPGGHIELNENPWQAIRHEIIEETGYQLSQLKILQPKIRMKTLSGAILHPIPVSPNTHNFDSGGNHKHTDEGYAFTANGAPLGQPDDGESVDIHWVSLDELKNLKKEEIFDNVRQVGEFVLSIVLSEWEAVELAAFEA
jgi:8-oxo-dGTP pyrophosphatase MutT (NUDIX family)